ncbi:MAG: hypothetical protein ABIO44_09530 [Saprospiraceae bacterium]
MTRPVNNFFSWNIVDYLIYFMVGLASLNLCYNYNSPVVYYPGDGSAVGRATPLGTPGSGSSGGSTTPISVPGGFESSFCNIFWINCIYIIFAVIGSILGGLIGRRYYSQNSTNYILIELVIAFILSRAVLYIGVFLWDLWR